MEHMPLVFSLLFFTAFAVYLFFGIHVIQLNPRAGPNRLLSALCVSLCLWALGFSIANSAATVETGLFWRRFSALGWTTAYSLLLHFLLVLSPDEHVAPRRRYLWLLHLPAAICLYVFAFSDELAAVQYNFVGTDFGWVNVAVRNGWDWFFYIYYGGYMLAGLGLMWHRSRAAEDTNVRKQARLIFTALLAALALGSLTDVVLPGALADPMPQMAPVITLVPVAAIYHSMRRYHMMPQTDRDGDGLILSHETRIKLYYRLAITFFAGGVLASLAWVLPDMSSENTLRPTLYTGGLLFILGAAILVFQLIKRENVKNYLVIGVVLFSIPVITLGFIGYSGITVWAFPIVIMMVALLFDKRTPLILVTGVAIVTQIMVWVFAPRGAVQVDEFDHIIRIGMFIIAFSIGSFVNGIFVKRIRENNAQIEFQTAISEISFDFVSVDIANIETRIGNMLARTGRLFQADRTYVVLFDGGEKTMTHRYEWRSGEKGVAKTVPAVPLDAVPLWMEQLRVHKHAYRGDMHKPPDKADPERALLAGPDTKSTVAVPIQEHGKLLGFMGLASKTAPRTWSRDDTGRLGILANLLADGLIKIRAEKEIEYMAYYDHLTGLANRALFTDRLEHAIRQAKRSETLLGVMFIDLDRFKAVNDTLGHSGGDAIIKEVARGLVGRLRETDTVARFGGDEFLILITNSRDLDAIKRVVGHIMSLFSRPLSLRGQEYFVTGSAGVAVYPIDGRDAGTLIKNADIAMYRAKSGGGNRYVLCTEDMKDEVKTHLALSNNLYRALERDELTVYYQPQVRLSTGEISGLEALLRWQHPEMGMISPGVFIPLAERNGLIHSIGEWVLETAAGQNKKWQDMGLPRVRMSVNLSVSQLNNPGLPESIGRILKETGLEPGYLELEITESVAIKEAYHTLGVFNTLKKLGVTISIDDFGTEYSSLSRLKILPVDRIKIDMQFIRGIEGSEKDQAITMVIINLAKSLGLEVLAEGVETALQLEFLNQKMCDEVQGYYCYRPMPGAEIEKVLRSSAKEGAGAPGCGG